jgi:hypothetical protein
VSDLPVIAGAFVSGFVAPSVVAWYALTSQRREEERLDRAELRTVLDAAAHALGDSRRAVDSVADRWRRNEPRSGESFHEAVQRHDRASAAAQDAKDRISIRLKGDDEAVTAFEKAAAALDDYAALLSPYLQGSGKPMDSEALNASRRKFLTALKGYYAAARKVAGGERRSGGRRIVGFVLLAVIVGGALLIGAAYQADRDGGGSDDTGVWSCAGTGDSSNHPPRATVKSGSCVFVVSATDTTSGACCVNMRGD